MKEITITVPDNCELKQDGNTYTIVEKEKKVTYDDVARELFEDSENVYYIDDDGDILNYFCEGDCINPTNCVSRKHAEKLSAINKLLNVAKYLNGDWQPNWDDVNEYKWCFRQRNGCIDLNFYMTISHCPVYFKSEELAKQAIEILGEETIKLALCTDY